MSIRSILFADAQQGQALRRSKLRILVDHERGSLLLRTIFVRIRNAWQEGNHEHNLWAGDFRDPRAGQSGHESSATYAGDVYWMKIAFAAVVSFVATTKATTMTP